MNPIVVMKPRADLDLDEQADYLARRNPQAARRFYDAAEKAFDLLAQMSELGSLCEFATLAAGGLRMWPIHGFENHIIFYRPSESGIQVVRVLHGARDLEAIFGR